MLLFVVCVVVLFGFILMLFRVFVCCGCVSVCFLIVNCMCVLLCLFVVVLFCCVFVAVFFLVGAWGGFVYVCLFFVID